MILKDGDKLLPSYIPAEIPHREKQVQQVLQYFSNVLDEPSSAGLKFYQIVGPVGSGKTLTAIKFGEAMEEVARRRGIDLKHVYVNPRQHGSTRLMIFRRIVQDVQPEIFSASYSAEELMMELLRYLAKKNRYLLITFDELDYFVFQSKEQIIYNLTRLNEMLPGQQCKVVGIVFTARSPSYQNRLDEAELSSLGRFYVKFEPYTSTQIYDILEKRSSEAIYPGKVGEQILKYIAELTSSPPIYGDIRYALSLLYNSCMLAQNRGEERLTFDHVRHVTGMLNPAIPEEELMYLPEDEKIILLSIADALKHSNSPYISFDQIAMQVEHHKKGGKVELRSLVKGVQDLSNRGIIEMRSLTEIGIPGIPAGTLERFLDFLITKLQQADV